MNANLLIRLEDFCKVGSGTTPPRQMAKEYFGGSIPWVKSGELRETVIETTEEAVTEQALKDTSLKLVPRGALLVAMYGATVGRVGLLGIDATTNQAVCHIIPDPKKADARYLFHALQDRTAEFLNRAVGGAQPNISQQVVKSTKIYLPSCSEQRRIAAILDQADALRAKRRKALAKLDEMAQANFVEMFGRPFDNPIGFELASLGEIIDFIGGSQPPKSRFLYEEGPNRVRFAQIRDFRTDEYKTYIPKELAKRPFAKDDVMIGRYGPPVFQIFRGLSGTYNVALMKAKPKAGVLKPFLFHLLQEHNLHSYVVSNSERTAGQSGVNLELLEKFPAYRPPLELQMKFSEFDRLLSIQREEQGLQLQRLEAFFSSLQHLAFRGEL